MDRVSQLKQEIDKVFKEQLTANQLWAITKLCKHVIVDGNGKEYLLTCI